MQNRFDSFLRRDTGIITVQFTAEAGSPLFEKANRVNLSAPSRITAQFQDLKSSLAEKSPDLNYIKTSFMSQTRNLAAFAAKAICLLATQSTRLFRYLTQDIANAAKQIATPHPDLIVKTIQKTDNTFSYDVFPSSGDSNNTLGTLPIHEIRKSLANTLNSQRHDTAYETEVAAAQALNDLLLKHELKLAGKSILGAPVFYTAIALKHLHRHFKLQPDQIIFSSNFEQSKNSAAQKKADCMDLQNQLHHLNRLKQEIIKDVKLKNENIKISINHTTAEINGLIVCINNTRLNAESKIQTTSVPYNLASTQDIPLPSTFMDYENAHMSNRHNSKFDTIERNSSLTNSQKLPVKLHSYIQNILPNQFQAKSRIEKHKIMAQLRQDSDLLEQLKNTYTLERQKLQNIDTYGNRKRILQLKKADTLAALKTENTSLEQKLIKLDDKKTSLSNMLQQLQSNADFHAKEI